MNTTEPVLGKLLTYSDAYQLLSMFLRLPTPEMVDGLVDGAIKQDILDIFEELGVEEANLREITGPLNCYVEASVEKLQLLSALRQEYTRLFNHPDNPAVHIYEALFLWDLKGEKDEVKYPKPRLFVSPAAMDAERLYKRANLMPSQAANESADFFATQLEFMMFVYAKLAEALKNDDKAQYKNLELILEEFSKLHLHRWAKAFFEKCEASSKNEVMTVFWKTGTLFFQRFSPN